MLKYLYCKEVFAEVPSEITLGVSISGCAIHCQGCHSRELWEDKGITCLCLFGGEHDIDTLTEIFQYAYKKIKTAWYCGLDMIPKDKLGIIQYLDYLKLGHYDHELGGLNSPTTNQRFYQIEHFPNGEYMKVDLTNKFKK